MKSGSFQHTSSSTEGVSRPGILFQGVFIALLSVLLPLNMNAQFMGGGYSELDDSPTTAAFREHVSYISSAAMEGRKAGSEGETLTAEYVYDILQAYGLEMLTSRSGEQFGISRNPGDTINSRNIIGVVQGYDHKLYDRYIVVAARMDNLGTHTLTVDGVQQEQIYYGANGNASGLAMMMELARMVNTNSVLFRRSVIFIGLGASAETYAGAWYFLNRAFSAPGSIDAMINLDMLGTGSGGFYAYTCSNDDMNRIVNELATTLQPVQPELVTREPVSSDHRIFYDKEIPSVFFTTGMYPEYNSPRDTESIIEYDDMERELEYIYNFTLKLANGQKPEFRHSEKSDLRRGLDREIYPYYECDTRPTFLGSPDPVAFLRRWVYVYLKYPRQAVEEGIQGKVLVDFVIDEKGKVKDAKVVKGVHPLLDDEALRVINASPDWKPGKVGGRKVKSEMSLYVEFRLEKKK